ncbi:MAG: four helix bundle protein [Opitutales bacterium]|nr:four helix bundle protein [Opitutales bacterium]
MHHENLEVWKLSIELVSEIYKISRKFPREAMFGLSAQMQRAAVSIPSNIAEGAARQSPKDFLKFVRIAQGSLAELQTQLIIARNIGYDFDSQPIQTMQQSVGRMLVGLARNLKSKLP